MSHPDESPGDSSPIDFTRPRTPHTPSSDHGRTSFGHGLPPASAPGESQDGLGYGHPPHAMVPEEDQGPVPQISLANASPRPPPLALGNTARSVSFQSGTKPEPMNHPLVDPPLHSPSTPLDATSSATHEASSTSILLPQNPPDSAGGWRVPAALLRPDTADVDDDTDYPTRQFDAEELSDSGKSSDAEDGVFAFNRPTTARPFAGPQAPSAGRKRKRLDTTPGNAPYAGIDMAGHMQDIDYDPAHPPIFSGRFNLNNQPFNRFREWKDENPTFSSRSTAAKIRPATQMTATSTVSSAPPPTGDSEAVVQTAARGRRVRRATADSASIVSLTESEYTEPPLGNTRRHSLPMTELSGDMTVPDGKTTWGDGNGGVFKGTSDSDGVTTFEDWDEDSPYAEVRASVSNIDDPDMPSLTIRSFLLGMFLCMLCAGSNTFLSFRNPSPQFPILIVQMIAYPLGKFCAWCLPLREYQAPRWLGGFRFSLNPCPFNVKEHTIIVMMATVAILPAYGLYSITSLDLFYKTPLGIGFNFTYILATQVTGLTIAGISRRFVVWPASMLWPGVLVTTTILNTLHADADIGTGGMSRQRFFTVMGAFAFFYYFLPGYLFTALSYFSYATWIAPRNHVVNQLMGVRTGMGMGIFVFDWAQISWIGSPLAAPWWAQVNIGIGFVIFYWLITPIMYYTNVWYTRFLPISAVQPADRFQNVYDVERVLGSDNKLNITAYAAYSPVYLTASFTMTYMLAFALTTSLIVYTGLVHGPRLWRIMWRISTEPDDIHMKLMRKYREVPDWWYGVIFVLCVTMGIVSVKVFHTGLPVWGYFVAIAMAWTYIIPVAIIFAMSNLEPTFNLIAELIPGYAFPGQPIPGMVFKTFAVQTLAEALYFTRDMKLGHYMKVPPRHMFICQMVACSISCVVQVGVKECMFATIPDLCQPGQRAQLICQNAYTSFTASIIWGLIGPARLFSKGGIYNPQLWMLLVGAVVPVPFWLYCRRYPQSIVRHINPSIVFAVCLSIPPASGINIASFLLVGFVFQFWIRRYYFAWWARYNYVLSAALDVGTVLGLLTVFLCLRLPKADLVWWGNTVYQKTTDWMGEARDKLPDGKVSFGPNTWKL
ncbi:hypothetical protein CspeluHIS016_0903110 [Cutaneotrichosporon spelunceum]|uniref:OPT-domain-containing protein n=1 Tax=Cutaneotrichosporon spelunceum TaxID=1672016 RepID=A0AAD3U0K0_9TREE|nr:hypothetical protein CspeluHIS016_0903110 [Cutaneotrichosporon spelunceum]